MWHKPCRTFHPWCLCIKTRCLSCTWEAVVNIPWWRHQMETFSALLVLCVGTSPGSGDFPSQRPVTQSFDVFFDLRMNKRLIWDAIVVIMTSLWCVLVMTCSRTAMSKQLLTYHQRDSHAVYMDFANMGNTRESRASFSSQTCHHGPK